MKMMQKSILLSILSVLLCLSLTGCIFLPGDFGDLGGIFDEYTEAPTDEEDGREDGEEIETVVEDHDATPEDFIFDENDPTRLVGVKDNTCSRYEIPNGTRVIGEDAFFDCIYAREILLPESVTELEERAFGWCESLTRVNFPSALTVIGRSAFEGCVKLERVTLPESVRLIGDYAFDGCAAIRELVIPADAEIGGTDAFRSCYPTRATLPASLLEYVDLNQVLTLVINGGESIEGDALHDADHLTSLTLPESLREADELSFYKQKLVEIYNFSDVLISRTAYDFPNSRIEIHTSPEEESHLFWDGDFLFYEKEDARYLMGYAGVGTEMLTLPENCHGSPYEVHDYAFHKIGVRVEEISIPAAVTGIGDCAFRQLPISKLLFAEDGMLRTIGRGAFEEVKIDALTLPASLERIGESAFWRCLNLHRVSFAENSRLISIGSSAFASCRFLESFTLPATVTLVGESAFFECMRLYEVCNLSPSVVKGEVGAHGGLFDYALAVHSNANAESFFVTTEDGFRFFLSEDGCCLTGYVGEGVIPALPTEIEGRDYAIAPYAFHIDTGAEFPAEYQIPNGVTSVGAYAFYAAGFECLTVGADVQSIGESAFCEERNLHTLTFVEGSCLAEIGADAFCSCEALSAVSLPASLRTIGSGAFSFCRSMESAVLLGEEVTKIEANAFLVCESLRTFRIHAAVDRVGWNAFGGCISLEELILEAPDGWVATYEWDTEGEERVVFDAATLSDPATAARIFSQEYAEREWYRNP